MRHLALCLQIATIFQMCTRQHGPRGSCRAGSRVLTGRPADQHVTLEDPPAARSIQRTVEPSARRGEKSVGSAPCTYERRTTCERQRPTPRPGTRRAKIGRRPGAHPDHSHGPARRKICILYTIADLFGHIKISPSEWLNFVF